MNYSLKHYNDNLSSKSSYKQLMFLFLVNFVFIAVSWFISNIEKSLFIDLQYIKTFWNVLATLIVVFFNLKIFHQSFKFNDVSKNNKGSALIALIFLCFILFFYIVDKDENNEIFFSEIIFYLSAAFFEEIVFRGFLLGVIIVLLKKKNIKNNVWLAVIISSFLFFLIHVPYTIFIDKVNIVNYVSIFLSGILFSWLYIKYSNILLVVYVHLILNLVLLVLPVNANILLLLLLEIILLFVIMASSNIINFSNRNKYPIYISLLFGLGLFSFVCLNENVEEYKIIEHNNEYSVIIPGNLSETERLNDLTTFQFENKREDFYIIILEQPKQIFYEAIDLGKFNVSKNIDGYQRIVENHFKFDINMRDFKLFDVSKEYKKITFTMTGIDKENNYPVFYRFSVIESETKFYQIMSWTNIKNSKNTITKMNAIIDSFKLLHE